MGAGTTRRGEQESGAMRGEVTTSRRVERWWQWQGDGTTSPGKLEGGALRGSMIPIWHVERWWHDKR
jgi:hypothetical protein